MDLHGVSLLLDAVRPCESRDEDLILYLGEKNKEKKNVPFVTVCALCVFECMLVCF